jgi:hypothetical protein
MGSTKTPCIQCRSLGLYTGEVSEEVGGSVREAGMRTGGNSATCPHSRPHGSLSGLSKGSTDRDCCTNSPLHLPVLPPILFSPFSYALNGHWLDSVQGLRAERGRGYGRGSFDQICG